MWVLLWHFYDIYIHVQTIFFILFFFYVSWFWHLATIRTTVCCSQKLCRNCFISHSKNDCCYFTLISVVSFSHTVISVHVFIVIWYNIFQSSPLGDIIEYVLLKVELHPKEKNCDFWSMQRLMGQILLARLRPAAVANRIYVVISVFIAFQF